MYASELDGRKLTFVVSGKLWGRSLVMADKETGSEWSHILGQSMAGPLKGKSLEIIPSAMTNWESWKLRHPQTSVVVIERTARTFSTEMLNKPREFGIGLVENGKSRFWRFDQLQTQPLVNDELSGVPLVVYYDMASRTPLVWKRNIEIDKVGGKKSRVDLTFASSAQGVQDSQTESTWDLESGVAIEGALIGTQLEAASAIMSFTASWKRFHPDTAYWLAESAE